MNKGLRGFMVLLLLVVSAGSSFAANTITKWPDNKKGAVSLTFDDGCASHLSLGIPALDARGLKGTFFLITNKVSSWDPWRNAAATGHEIGSHTISHPYLTLLSPTEIQDELAGSKAAVDAQIPSQKCLTLAYPYGDVNASVESIAASLYMSSRGVFCDLNTAPYDFSRVNACSPDDGNFDDIYARADDAEQQAAWLVAFIHSLNGGSDCWGTWTINMWTDYLDYLMTKNLWVGTFGTIVKYIKERDSATLSVVSSTSSQIVLSLTDTMDDAIYDEPLTIRSDVPSNWTYVTVQQGSNATTVTSTVEGAATAVYFGAVPDRGSISLVRSDTAGNLAPAVTTNAATAVTSTGAR